MDITSFIHTRRSDALLIGDHGSYRRSLARQILSTRRRLGIATPRREKFAPDKKPFTAEDVGKDKAYLDLLLLTAERPWAQALHFKSVHGEAGAVQGRTRQHIISRLTKAVKAAQKIVEVLRRREASKATDVDLLEARCYLATLEGAAALERRTWEACLNAFALARVGYAALLTSAVKHAGKQKDVEVFREMLEGTVDPSLRYAAYQAKIDRSMTLPAIAKRRFPSNDGELKSLVEAIDPAALQEDVAQKPTDAGDASVAQGEVPTTITWRNRKANIIDGAIGFSLASAQAAEAHLWEFLSSNANANARDKAAAFDPVLLASQDTADATRRAMDYLEKERVDESDARMQDLRVISLAVNYALVGWRIGRNRTLIGADDGLSFEPQAPKAAKVHKKSKDPDAMDVDGPVKLKQKMESRSRQLARLRERVVLYDSIIQSLDSVKQIRGAMRDAGFVAELEGRKNYFRALKCINIAFSHSLLGSQREALALLKRAGALAAACSSIKDKPTEEKALRLQVLPSHTKALQQRVSEQTSRTHAFVELQSLSSPARSEASVPVVQRLGTYYPPPGTEVDLKNLVSYPPKLEPVPVKPLFLDVAWNYIEYPGRKHTPDVVATKAVGPVVNGVGEKDDGQDGGKKKGWFGFGR